MNFNISSDREFPRQKGTALDGAAAFSNFLPEIETLFVHDPHIPAPMSYI
jgi:hypothetical protein